MSKIDRPGAGGPRQISIPESAENIKESAAAAGEAAKATANSAVSDAAANLSRPVAGRSAAGDLMAAGNRLQSELHKELEAKKPRDADKEKEMAMRVAQNMPRFAPPYVPVGPVVMGDNISAPGHTAASSQMNELNLRPDQFQFNDQGNLVITNEKLIEFFKSLKNAQGDIRLGFIKMNRHEEE